MRVVLSTPLVLARLNRDTRPYNFLFCPLVDSVVGYPRGIDRDQFTLIAPFTKDRERWLELPCINACDGTRFALALNQDLNSTKVVPQTFGYVSVCIRCTPNPSLSHRMARRVEIVRTVCCCVRRSSEASATLSEKKRIADGNTVRT